MKKTLLCYSKIFWFFCWVLSGTIAYASSPQRTPPETQHKHLEIVSPTTPITNTNYSSFPQCSAANSSNCITIGGTGTTNCADFCSVTRVITDDPSIPGRVLSLVDPVCPEHYKIVQTFNEQPEYLDRPYSDIYPSNITQLNTLQAEYYRCQDGANLGCHRTCNSGWDNGHSCMPRGYRDVRLCDGPGTYAVVNFYGCDCPSPTGLSVDCNAGAWKWDNCANRVHCIRNAGLYPTSRSVPASFLCGRVYTTWR